MTVCIVATFFNKLLARLAFTMLRNFKWFWAVIYIWQPCLLLSLLFVRFKCNPRHTISLGDVEKSRNVLRRKNVMRNSRTTQCDQKCLLEFSICADKKKFISTELTVTKNHMLAQEIQIYLQTHQNTT